MVDQAKTGLGIEDLLADKREEILRIAARRKAYNVRVFGSVARGEATPDSDIDFLVDFEPDYGLLDHIGLIQELEDLLGRKVDVANQSNLKELIRHRVIESAISLDDIPAKIGLRSSEGAYVRDERLYLADIIQRIDFIESTTAEGRDQFMSSQLHQDAVIRSFEVIGEAVKRLKPETIGSYPQVKWSELAKFRDFLIHHYDQVEPEKIWGYIENDLPPLKAAVEMIVTEMDG
jgi:uncharacterized protein with HEPN domain/predicted nucleotidyltransferase